MLSVIIPAYNEEAILPKTVSVIGNLLTQKRIPYELIFVDDASRDRTWALIQEHAVTNPQIRGVHFSRNFGKEAAIMAGLTEAEGDCCVVIDCDLQHPPEKIPEMYALWQQGFEIVEGRKSNRGKEGVLHSVCAKSFYTLISSATGIDMSNASDFKLLDRSAVNALLNMRERNTFFRALSSWIGFRSTFVEFEVREREAGVTKWSPFSLIKYALSNISSFSAVPMQIVTVLGMVMLLSSIVLGSIALGQKFLGQALEGFTTVILLQLFSSSVIMISLGIIGYYIARIYEEIKGRPRYIIASRVGSKKNEATVCESI